ncbi:hypothetical protein KJZ61_01870 [Candidatus Dependentiae bacterium]|nr:hypothetical protein [Candidatus Dependentiae bacterium]
MILPLNNIPPALIMVGDATSTLNTTITYLQQLFCTRNSCSTCSTCLLIQQQQFYAATWLSTDKHYTLDDLDVIFSTTAYALQEQDKHFFIINTADLLTPACSNSLLKMVEEPPAGYHFIFLTSRLSAVLPTIRSRCTIITLTTTNSSLSSHALFTCFTNQGSLSPADFLKILEQDTTHERETLLIIDALITYWHNKYQQATMQSNSQEAQQAQKIILALQQALAKPPMPGSSKLFWRTLYLTFNHLL